MGYGSRLGAGCYWRFGIEDYKPRDYVRRYNPGPLMTCDSAEVETLGEGIYWQRRRMLDEFSIRAPEVSRSAFLREARWVGVQPREPGQENPPGSYRYRIIGAASWDDRELVIDLGFWIGPLAVLNTACTAAEQAIIRRWVPCERFLSRRSDTTPNYYYQSAVIIMPQSKAGFAWAIAQ